MTWLFLEKEGCQGHINHVRNQPSLFKKDKYRVALDHDRKDRVSDDSHVKDSTINEADPIDEFQSMAIEGSDEDKTDDDDEEENSITDSISF